MRKTATAIIGLLAVVGTSPALAQETSITKVNCSSKVKLQSRLNAAKAGAVNTFLVTGTCNENLIIQQGKNIVIIGSGGAKITPANNALPAVLVNGSGEIRSMRIENPAGTADSLVTVQRGGYLAVAGSDFYAPKVESVVGIWLASSAEIVNSRIVGGSYSGIEVFDSSSVKVEGTPTAIDGPAGKKVLINSPDGEDGAVFCGMASAVNLRSSKVGTGLGAIEISNSKVGLTANRGCALQLKNYTGDRENLKISGMTRGGIGVDQGTLLLVGVSITGSGDLGLGVRATDVTIEDTLFSGNKNADIVSGYGADVMINGGSGGNDFPDAFDKNTLQCWPDGSDSNGEIGILSGAVTIPAGKTIGDLHDRNCAWVQDYQPE
jgi:hypothetical protein